MSLDDALEVINIAIPNCKKELFNFLKWLGNGKYTFNLENINIYYDHETDNCYGYTQVKENYTCEIATDYVYVSGADIYITKLWIDCEFIEKVATLVHELAHILDHEFSLICVVYHSRMIADVRSEFVALTYEYLYYVYKGLDREKIKKYISESAERLWIDYFKGLIDFNEFLEILLERIEKHAKNFLKTRNIFLLHSEALYHAKKLLTELKIPAKLVTVTYII